MRERLLGALRNAQSALRRRWWWWILLFLAGQLWEVTKHRIYGDINAAIDTHSGEVLQFSKPYILMLVTSPLLISLLIFIGIVSVIVIHAYMDTLPSKTDVDDVETSKMLKNAKPVEGALVLEVSKPPIAVGLTFDFAEVETHPDNSSVGYKFKLRVYWTNHSGETIHLGVPEWKDGIWPQGAHLTYFYQARQQNNQEDPWGNEAKELDVSAGQRCRIWLGLDPARRKDALELLDKGQLGLLIIPVSTQNYLVNIRIRPNDRDLTRFDAQEYYAQKKAVHDRYIVLSQEAKALLSLIRVRRVVSQADIARHFQQYDLPSPERTLSDLRNDSVPFLAPSGQEIKMYPILEKVISETVRADDAEFLKAAKGLTGDAFGYRAKTEPGFKGRYNALASK